jgi:iron(III) transport system permease protein
MVIKYIDHSLDESGQMGGLPWWRRFVYILSPLSMKGLLVAWFLVYLFSITDLDTAILVHPPGKGTLPVRIFNLLHFGRQEWVGALCIVLIALTILPYMAVALWGSKEADAHFRMPSN